MFQHTRIRVPNKRNTHRKIFQSSNSVPSNQTRGKFDVLDPFCPSIDQPFPEGSKVRHAGGGAWIVCRREFILQLDQRLKIVEKSGEAVVRFGVRDLLGAF